MLENTVSCMWRVNVSVCVCVQCMFAHSLRKFSMRDWGIEQKWMSILLPLLLLYNGESVSSIVSSQSVSSLAHVSAFALLQIPSSRCRSWWTAGFPVRWTLSSRRRSCARCFSSGCACITASGCRWESVSFFLLVQFLILAWSQNRCVLCSGREKVLDVLPAQTGYSGVAVAVGRHAGNLANVRNARETSDASEWRAVLKCLFFIVLQSQRASGSHISIQSGHPELSGEFLSTLTCRCQMKSLLVHCFFCSCRAWRSSFCWWCACMCCIWCFWWSERAQSWRTCRTQVKLRAEESFWRYCAVFISVLSCLSISLRPAVEVSDSVDVARVDHQVILHYYHQSTHMFGYRARSVINTFIFSSVWLFCTWGSAPGPYRTTLLQNSPPTIRIISFYWLDRIHTRLLKPSFLEVCNDSISCVPGLNKKTFRLPSGNIRRLLTRLLNIWS